ncbi:MAG: methionine--tRNA ligase subunit beta [Dehalococcoidia bacterium]|nr:methionine--tRNA ligase subunit beta [Dehalococcoidia bacterium]
MLHRGRRSRRGGSETRPYTKVLMPSPGAIPVVFTVVKHQEIAERTPAFMISIEDFARLDLRIGEVVSARPVVGAKRLLQLEVDLGEERRTLVAGVAEHRSPEELVGRQIVVVANLEPAIIRGITSQGMLLAAQSPDGTLALLTVDQPLPNGAKVG